MKKTIWISYDLGVRGDYEGMYSWLDDKDAEECGSSVAVLKGYEFEGDLVDHLKNDICGRVDLDDRRSRIYAIFKEGDRVKGKYLVGKRKVPPWTGYGDVLQQEPDEG